MAARTLRAAQAAAGRAIRRAGMAVAAAFLVLAAALGASALDSQRRSGAVAAFPGRWGESGITQAGRQGPGSGLAVQVVAHSNHPLDQAAKLAVRDAVVQVLQRWQQELGPWQPSTRAAWQRRLVRGQVALVHAVRQALAVGPWPQVGFEVRLWPAAAPVGVQVRLGAARGHNWWCVAFPLLCPGVRPEPTRAWARTGPQSGSGAAAGGGGEARAQVAGPGGKPAGSSAAVPWWRRWGWGWGAGRSDGP